MDVKGFLAIKTWLTYSLFIAFLSSSVIVLLLCWSNYVIVRKAHSYLFTSIQQLPFMKVALVLGTSAYTSEGHRNAHYYERLTAAKKLYISGKVKYIIVSGDNRSRYYNEPARMKKDLTRMGIPNTVIYCDYAGFRTLDSVVRAKRVFGQKSFIIVSQEYQNIRAVYIARQYGIDAIAFNAEGDFAWFDARNQLRKWFARLLAVIQVNLFYTQPHFLGQPVIPGVNPPS